MLHQEQSLWKVCLEKYYEEKQKKINIFILDLCGNYSAETAGKLDNSYHTEGYNGGFELLGNSWSKGDRSEIAIEIVDRVGKIQS